MRILLVPSSYGPKVGGLETATAYLGAELVRRGHSVTVITNRYPRTLRAYEMIDGIPVHRILMTNLWLSGRHLTRLAKYVVGIALAPIQTLRLAQFIRTLQPAIINSHYLGTPAIYTRTANMLCPARRLVLSVHGSDLTTTPYPTGNPMLSRYVVNGVHVSTACSNNQALFLRQMMGAGWEGQVVVTGNGVEPRELQSDERFEHPRPYIFTAARLIPKKGLDVLIHALKRLHEAGEDVDLIVAGSGPLEESLRGLAQQLGLEQRVRFWGLANRRELVALLNGCVLFALPSLWEAFGIASLEAMICARAVVASNCGGIPEVVRDGETGLLVPPGDAAALSDAIATLLHDQPRREALGRRGREVALRQFSWSAVADRYLEAYAMALESQP